MSQKILAPGLQNSTREKAQMPILNPISDSIPICFKESIRPIQIVVGPALALVFSMLVKNLQAKYAKF